MRAYRYGPQVLWMEEGGNIFFLHADGQGSVRVVTNLSGQVVAEYSYDAFGNQLEGEDGWNPFKYCGIFGYREDEEINLMKVGARFYDPAIGRWIQKDPILSGVNWWVYCENEPVNGVDPDGEITFMGAVAIIVIIAIVVDHFRPIIEAYIEVRYYIVPIHRPPQPHLEPPSGPFIPRPSETPFKPFNPPFLPEPRVNPPRPPVVPRPGGWGRSISPNLIWT